MSAAAEISERIALLTNAYQEVTVQIDRLAGLTDAGTEEARGELAGLIQQGLKEGEAELETLGLRIATLSPAADPQAALEARVHHLREEFKTARTNARKALLTSKRASALSARRQRQLLSPSSPPSSTASPSPSSPQTPISGAQLYRRPYHDTRAKRKSATTTQDDMLTSASSDVTAALRRTHALMSAELTRSHFAHDTLSQSTAALRELSTSYSAFDGALKRSKGLITSLVRKNKSDMWYYQMSLYALVATIAWLVFRRLLWGPVWLLVWMPLRLLIWLVVLPFRVPNADVAGAGGGGGTTGSVVSSVETTTVTSTVAKVVESMTVAEKVGGEDEAAGEEAGDVKTIVLDSGVEVEVPLNGGEAVHDEL
ncbi:hypothetical protein Dda_0789 [Drechslerella dactyloides]|uniref:Sec20 C-terminal domain-containing protein n=1 Tax=Drechslerella dactyloides TaxID=74499 RepID=A0AAD6NNP4_DREDA|nr:hypothetical protein Dda_0789 [Drechslerella dactyloides]